MKWAVDGKTEELVVGSNQRKKGMLSMYTNGNPQSVTFSASEQQSGRPLSINNLDKVQAQSAITKQYKFMRIDGN